MLLSNKIHNSILLYGKTLACTYTYFIPFDSKTLHGYNKFFPVCMLKCRIYTRFQFQITLGPINTYIHIYVYIILLHAYTFGLNLLWLHYIRSTVYHFLHICMAGTLYCNLFLWTVACKRLNMMVVPRPCDDDDNFFHLCTTTCIKESKLDANFIYAKWFTHMWHTQLPQYRVPITVLVFLTSGSITKYF